MVFHWFLGALHDMSPFFIPITFHLLSAASIRLAISQFQLKMEICVRIIQWENDKQKLICELVGPRYVIFVHHRER